MSNNVNLYKLAGILNNGSAATGLIFKYGDGTNNVFEYVLT